MPQAAARPATSMPWASRSRARRSRCPSADLVAQSKRAYPLFAQIRQIQLETGLNGTRNVPAERGIPAWKRMREVLTVLREIGIPGLEVSVPDDAEIERESKDFEHSSINGHVSRPLGWFTKTYGFRSAGTWPTDGGFVLPAPVSDGTRAYVAMGQGQVAAYDLTGRKVWAHHHAKGQGGNCSFYPSPIIVDGRLIVQHDARLRAYALDDGATRWDVESDPIKSHNMGTAHVLRPDGRTAYLVLANGHVVQVADGKTIGDLQVANAGSGWGGVSGVGDGKDTVYFLPGNNGGGEMAAIRVVVTDGAATRQDRWKGPHKNRSITPVLHEGLLCHSHDDKATVVCDVTTGEIIKALPLGTRWPSFAIAGRNPFVALGSGDVQIATVGRETVVVGVNRLGGTGNQSPGGKCEAAPTFAGDAVILRAHDFLWCFGGK
jgi:hypothetical protein